MDRLDGFRLLVAAMEEGSLAKAGARLSRSPAAVSRAVSALEAAAGERLLHRSARGLRLTPAGERHVAAYRRILAEVDGLEQEGASPRELRGEIRLTAPELFGRLIVLPVVQGFQERHPGISVRLFLQNRLVSLVDEGMDVAVRLSPLPDSGLSAVRLGEMQRLVCASPAYLARHGEPQAPADLSSHACIGRDVASEDERWTFRFPAPGGARRRSLAVPSRLKVGGAAVALDVALSGGGIGQFMAYQVADDLSAGRLVRLLTPFEIEAAPVHLVFPGAIHPGGAVRALIDHAVPHLRRRIADVQRPLSEVFAPD